MSSAWSGGAAGARDARRARLGAPALSLVLLALLAGIAGCGESSSPTSSSSSAVAPPAGASAVVSSNGSASHVPAVAFVVGRPIAKSSYEHWLVVERALGGNVNAGHRALGFLLTSAWLFDEAKTRGVSVSATEAKQRLEQLKRQTFSKAGSLQKYLAKAHETEADLLERVEVELLESRIAAQVAAGQSAARRKATLASFQQAFLHRWKSRTKCDAGYVMEDCSEYTGKLEDLAGASPQSSSGASSGGAAASSSAHSKSSASGSSANGASNATGEVYSPAGGMSISSSAFERNGAIPSQYTCDGANISPPLEWQNVPAKAGALVLFIIDDSASGPASGIRWVVGDISPTSNGVAAGKTPEGGIVGSDSQGHAGYGGICPPHGKTSTVEFVLYALKKKIALSPGFSPGVAESEYGSGKDLLGSAAITYAVYHRS